MAEFKFDLTPHQTKHFFKKLCLIAARYRKRQNAKQHLYEHLKSIKKHSKKKNFHEDLSKLQDRISHYVLSEKQIRYHGRLERNKTNELQGKINSLRNQYETVVKERDTAVEQNKEIIQHLIERVKALSKEVALISKVMHMREQRKHSLEKKIEDKIKGKPIIDPAP